MAIEVIAKQRGFYGRLREKGDRFVVKSEADLGRWMDVVLPPPEPAEPAKHDDKHTKKAKA